MEIKLELFQVNQPESVAFASSEKTTNDSISKLSLNVKWLVVYIPLDQVL